MRADERSEDHPGALLVERAIRRELRPGDEGLLRRHLAACGWCAAELEAARVFAAFLTPGRLDQALSQAAVEGALERVGRGRPFGFAVRRLLGPRSARAVLTCSAAAAVLFVWGHGRAPSRRAGEGRHLPPAIVLADGSEIRPDPGAPAAAPYIEEETQSVIVVRLDSGGAEFRVRHAARRSFRVEAGPFEIRDVGTVFHVGHEPGGRVRVTVSEGRVAVARPEAGLRVELRAGEERVFGPVQEPPSNRAESPLPPVPSPVHGGHAQAAPAADEPAKLLAWADVARHLRKFEVATSFLRQLVEHYPADPRAASAAFTLGWVLQTDLGRPREAAVAFSQAETLSRGGPLAEDSAARVAEAWKAAGDARRAAEAARHYQQTYPTGQSVGSMRGLARGP